MFINIYKYTVCTYKYMYICVYECAYMRMHLCVCVHVYMHIVSVLTFVIELLIFVCYKKFYVLEFNNCV